MEKTKNTEKIRKLPIFDIIVVLLIVAGIGAFLLFSASTDEPESLSLRCVLEFSDVSAETYRNITSGSTAYLENGDVFGTVTAVPTDTQTFIYTMDRRREEDSSIINRDYKQKVPKSETTYTVTVTLAVQAQVINGEWYVGSQLLAAGNNCYFRFADFSGMAKMTSFTVLSEVSQ